MEEASSSAAQVSALNFDSSIYVFSAPYTLGFQHNGVNLSESMIVNR